MGLIQSKPTTTTTTTTYRGMTPEEKQKYDWDVERYQEKRMMLSKLPRGYAVDQCKTSEDVEFSPRRPNTFNFSNVRVPSAISKGLTVGEDITEYIDDLTLIQEKISQVAKDLLNSKHCVVYSGAGISTSADIPDFRGPDGCWTKQDRGIHDTKKIPTLTEIAPTYAHMAISKLIQVGLIKCVITTNMDNLHIKSGTPLENIVELHGNSFKHRCTVCKESQHLNEEVYNSPMSKCVTPNCTGIFVDTIVNFAEPIDDSDWIMAKQHSEMSDYSIVLGTSMRVLPACILPEVGPIKNNGKMVICNLQITPYDDNSNPRLFCTTDEFMYYLMKELNIEVSLETSKGELIKKKDFPIENKEHWKSSKDIPESSYNSFNFLF